MALDLSTCLYIQSNNLARLLSRMADEAFREVGLSPSHAFLLMKVQDEPGVQPSRLSEILHLSPSTITRLIEKMENKGYLKRISKGRATSVEPTTRLKEKEKAIREAWNGLQEQYREALGDRYSEVLTEMSVKAVDQLEENS